MSRTIRKKKLHRSHCDCKYCQDGRRYQNIREDAAAKEAIKETRKDRER